MEDFTANENWKGHKNWEEMEIGYILVMEVLTDKMYYSKLTYALEMLNFTVYNYLPVNLTSLIILD